MLLDLINILTLTHTSAHVASKVFLRVTLAGADPLVLICTSPANAKKKEPTSGLEPLTCSSYEFACVRSSPYWCVRKLRLFRGFSVCQSQSCVRCVLACTSPVAVRLQ